MAGCFCYFGDIHFYRSCGNSGRMRNAFLAVLYFVVGVVCVRCERRLLYSDVYFICREKVLTMVLLRAVACSTTKVEGVGSKACGKGYIQLFLPQ